MGYEWRLSAGTRLSSMTGAASSICRASRGFSFTRTAQWCRARPGPTARLQKIGFFDLQDPVTEGQYGYFVHWRPLYLHE